MAEPGASRPCRECPPTCGSTHIFTLWSWMAPGTSRKGSSSSGGSGTSGRARSATCSSAPSGGSRTLRRRGRLRISKEEADPRRASPLRLSRDTHRRLDRSGSYACGSPNPSRSPTTRRCASLGRLHAACGHARRRARSQQAARRCCATCCARCSPAASRTAARCCSSARCRSCASRSRGAARLRQDRPGFRSSPPRRGALTRVRRRRFRESCSSRAKRSSLSLRARGTRGSIRQRAPMQITWIIALVLYVVALLGTFGVVAQITGQITQWSWIIGFGLMLVATKVKNL